MTHDEELLKQSLETRQPILFWGPAFLLVLLVEIVNH